MFRDISGYFRKLNVKESIGFLWKHIEVLTVGQVDPVPIRLTREIFKQLLSIPINTSIELNRASLAFRPQKAFAHLLCACIPNICKPSDMQNKIEDEIFQLNRFREIFIWMLFMCFSHYASVFYTEFKSKPFCVSDIEYAALICMTISHKVRASNKQTQP